MLVHTQVMTTIPQQTFSHLPIFLTKTISPNTFQKVTLNCSDVSLQESEHCTDFIKFMKCFVDGSFPDNLSFVLFMEMFFLQQILRDKY